jgi:hypothetical protein
MGDAGVGLPRDPVEGEGDPGLPAGRLDRDQRGLMVVPELGPVLLPPVVAGGGEVQVQLEGMPVDLGRGRVRVTAGVGRERGLQRPLPE